MRIISKKHDYYDCIQKYGQDDILYIRDEKEITVNFSVHSVYESVGSQDSGFSVHNQLIGFCGKLYPCIYLRYPQYGDKGTCYYTMEQLDHHIEKTFPKLVEEFNKKSGRRFRSYIRGWRTSVRDEVKGYLEWFNKPENLSKLNTLIKLFELAPLFSVHRHSYNESKVQLNCLLREYEFYKVFDVQRTFQELEMWMSNIAKPIKPIPHIDDVTMAEAKGFDRFSFRKEKKK